MNKSEPQKRRGRPRVPEDERKRHTLTFRMRADLREAVEELAQANGRTLSEQVEYYVDAAVWSEAKKIYEYSTDAMSPTLHRCITSRDSKEALKLSVSFPTTHREMLHISGKSLLNAGHSDLYPLDWSQAPAGRAAAVAMARAMLDATRKGTVEALATALGAEAVEAALAIEALEELSARPHFAQAVRQDGPAAPAADGAEARNPLSLAELEAEMERLLGPGRAPKARLPDEEFAAFAKEREDGFPLDALAARVGRMLGASPDFRLLSLSSWPRKFADLPPDTRAGLVGALKGEASAVYEAMMRPDLPPDLLGQSPTDRDAREAARLERMIALVRMQRALLLHPDDGEAVEAGEGRPAGREGTA